MALKLFTPDTVGGTRTSGAPYISFSATAGTISFSKEATEALELKKDESIILAQDDISPKDWFVLVVKKKEGFAIRPRSSDNHEAGICFNSTATVNKLRKVFATPPPRHVSLSNELRVSKNRRLPGLCYNNKFNDLQTGIAA